MRFFRNASAQETLPPTQAEMLEDRNSDFKKVLSEYGIERVEVQVKSHENEAGIHLFVRLHKCSSEHWAELHEQSAKIKKKLRSRGVRVVEIFYAHCN